MYENVIYVTLKRNLRERASRSVREITLNKLYKTIWLESASERASE